MSDGKGIDGPLTARQLILILWAPVAVAAIIWAIVVNQRPAAKPFDQAQFDREGRNLQKNLDLLNQIESREKAEDATPHP